MFSSKGFTLIEVLLVIIILAIVFFPILRMFSQGIVASSEAEGTITATFLSSSKMEGIKNTSFVNIVSESRAPIPDFPKFQREVIVTEPHPNLKDVQIKVYFPIRGEEINVSLQTLVANY